MSEVIPYLYVKGAAQAIDFYARAFGARETYARITDGAGRVGHAEITIGASTLMLADGCRDDAAEPVSSPRVPLDNS